jgi:hypothetical protein
VASPVFGRAVLRGNAGSSRERARGSMDVASRSWLDGESLPSDEVRGRMGLITLPHEASHSHRSVLCRKVRMAPIESRRFGQAMARALIGASQTRKGSLAWHVRDIGDFAEISEGLEASKVRGHATGSVRGEGLG